MMCRYLRYKGTEKNAVEYWDKDLERANNILHNEVLRMHRDKLCTGRARFDWQRTRFTGKIEQNATLGAAS
jgi:hypothetical protein